MLLSQLYANYRWPKKRFDESMKSAVWLQQILNTKTLKGHYRCFSSSLFLLLPLTSTVATQSPIFQSSTPILSQQRNPRQSNNAWFQPSQHTTTTSNMCLTTDSKTLPTTMTGPPVASLIEPGHCQFTTESTSVPLLERWKVSPTTMVLRFGLPDTTKSLQLSTCACILAHTKMDEEDVVRPYTPISTNANIGYFDLLVKHYGPTAKMSRYMHDIMKIGDTLDFKHIEFNVKIQAPFGNPKHICMLVGGTGISPMIQALHAILGTTSDTSSSSTTKVTMLYGSKFANDILGSEILEQWSNDYKDRLEVIHILSDEPTENSTWTGLRGFINQTYIEKHVPPPSENPLIFICGPPPMYNALSGPREEKEVTGLLGTMGYQTEHVYKF
jgi:cytochrome-b5 reductase